MPDRHAPFDKHTGAGPAPETTQVITRRQLLQGAAGSSLMLGTTGGYALAEPWRLSVTRYALTPPGWTPGLTLRIAALADFHFCDPWMTPEHTARIVAQTNALKPDVVVLLGDYEPGYRMAQLSRPVPRARWAASLAELKAPFGIHAVLGNHDWWSDPQAQRERTAPAAERALVSVGIQVHNNRAVRFTKDGKPFWIAGLADQWALFKSARPDAHRARTGAWYQGLEDVPGTLAQVTDAGPVVLLAHEPDIFPKVPDRVALTLAGHTHGGQVTFMGYAPRVPSRFGRRYVYGHIVEQNRNLIVSGGLGCSGVPVRLGVPPEIVLVELGGPAVA